MSRDKSTTSRALVAAFEFETAIRTAGLQKRPTVSALIKPTNKLRLAHRLLSAFFGLKVEHRNKPDALKKMRKKWPTNAYL